VGATGQLRRIREQPDGYYVIRTTADPKRHLLESNESNNVGYAYVRVVGDQVNMLETGMGSDPWIGTRS